MTDYYCSSQGDFLNVSCVHLFSKTKNSFFFLFVFILNSQLESLHFRSWKTFRETYFDNCSVEGFDVFLFCVSFLLCCFFFF